MIARRGWRPVVGLLALLLVVASSAPASEEPSTTYTVSKAEFVKRWIAALEATGIPYGIEIVNELEIAATVGSLTVRASAEQAYESYLAEPGTLNEQIAASVRMVGDLVGTSPPLLSRIVPVIKKLEWLNNGLDCQYYPLPGDLIAVLAEDRPDAIRFLRVSDLEPLEMPFPELFTVAIGNLRRIAPVEERDLGDSVLLTSGGHYEAGMMLDGDLIASYQDRFAGEVVFSVPAPEVFMLTGRDNSQGLAGLVQLICATRPSKRLSSKLFAARDGGLVIAGEVDCGGERPTLTLAD